MKKILVDAHVFDGMHQGTRTYLKGIYSQFCDEGFTIYFAAGNVENLKLEFDCSDNFKFIKLKSKNKFIRLGYEFPKLIKKHDIDFAHFNYILPLFLNKKCKYIVTIHDVLFLDFPEYFSKVYRIKNYFLFKRSALKSDILLTVSEYSKNRIKAHFNLGNKRISVTPNAVDTKFYQEIEQETSKEIILNKFGIKNYILSVGRIEKRKNHISILNAFLKLELWKENILIVFIGKEVEEIDDLQNRISEIEKIAPKSFHHLDYINNEDLVHFYNAARLCVFPSLCEGFGIPPLESAVVGTSTLCSNRTAMSDFDFFEDDLYDPTDDEVLSTQIINRMTLEQIPQKSLKSIIEERFSWEKSAQVLINEIKRV